MKRFFQTVEREVSFKKTFVDAVQSDPSTEGPTSATAAVAQDENFKDPLKFMSWNANSFLLRLKNNIGEVVGFLQRFDPDVIAIQEVRIPAAGRKGEYKNPAEMKDDTGPAKEDKQIMMRILSRPPFNNYKVWWSLAETKYGGTALFVKHCCKPVNVTFSLDKMGKHETDGRVILAEFNEFCFLNTYTPNNGWKDEEQSFQRRREWDKRLLEFVLGQSVKPLIWCGDLNVSHEDIDVSHPEFFRNAKLPGYIPSRIEDCGQPGFTKAERQRFGNILKGGDLVDTYRWLHQNADTNGGYTWSGNPVGKYRGKRMRIDYFIISRKLLPKLVASEIHGRGIEMEGFYGSDHCPITMEMS